MMQPLLLYTFEEVDWSQGLYSVLVDIVCNRPNI